MNILAFNQKKLRGEKIVILTGYDYSSARIISETSIDCILVGDSVAMTMHGFPNTLAATLPMMEMHTQAVSRGTQKQFIITDMPFLSYRKNLTTSVSAAQKLMQAGAHAVKLEGASGNLKLIQHLTESGIPVMGHLGLTPQFINLFGGYKVQGKSDEAQEKIIEDALALQTAGCFAVVLECVPAKLAKKITEKLVIPTIGIGAGPFTDGQVLVFHDLLGLNSDFNPKFVKQYLNGKELLIKNINHFVSETLNQEFPQDEHCF